MHNAAARPWHRTVDVVEIVAGYAGLRLTVRGADAEDLSASQQRALRPVLELRRVCRDFDIAVANEAQRMLAVEASVGREHLIFACDSDGEPETGAPDVARLEAELGRALRVGIIDSQRGKLLPPVLSAAVLAGREASSKMFDALLIRQPVDADDDSVYRVLIRLYATHFAAGVKYLVVEGSIPEALRKLPLEPDSTSLSTLANWLLADRPELAAVRPCEDGGGGCFDGLCGLWCLQTLHFDAVARFPTASQFPALRHLAFSVVASDFPAAHLQFPTALRTLSLCAFVLTRGGASMVNLVDAALADDMANLAVLELHIVMTAHVERVAQRILRRFSEMPPHKRAAFERVRIGKDLFHDTSFLSRMAASPHAPSQVDLLSLLLRALPNVQHLRCASHSIGSEGVDALALMRALNADAGETAALVHHHVKSIGLVAVSELAALRLFRLLPTLTDIELRCTSTATASIAFLEPHFDGHALERVTTADEPIHMNAAATLAGQHGATLRGLPRFLYPEIADGVYDPEALAPHIAECPELRDENAEHSAAIAIAVRDHGASFPRLQSWRGNLEQLSSGIAGPSLCFLGLHDEEIFSPQSLEDKLDRAANVVVFSAPWVTLTPAHYRVLSSLCPSLQSIVTAMSLHDDPQDVVAACSGFRALRTLHLVHPENADTEDLKGWFWPLIFAFAIAHPHCRIRASSADTR